MKNSLDYWLYLSACRYEIVYEVLQREIGAWIHDIYLETILPQARGVMILILQIIMLNSTKAFTLIEIIISIAIISLIFTLTHSASSSLVVLLNDTDAELYASNIAKSGIDKFQIYRKYYSTTYSDNAWSNFFNVHTPWYYMLSWSLKLSRANNFKDFDFNSGWEWPLDQFWNPKSDTSGISYYRTIKIADYDYENNTRSQVTLFDIGDTYKPGEGLEEFDNKVKKVDLSYPYLERVTQTASGIVLSFTGAYNIFTTKSIFISSTTDMAISSSHVDISISTGSYYVSPDESNFAKSHIAFIRFKDNDLSGKSLTISWSVFTFWGNVALWQDIDESVYNLDRSIKETLNSISSFIFYPNRCTISKALDLYSPEHDSKIILNPNSGNRCFDKITINGNNLTISGSVNIENVQLNPNYFLKFSTEAMPNDYTLFMSLISDKTWGEGPFVNTSTGVSSIYKIWSKVLWVRDNKIILDEVMELYFSDVP